MSFPEPADLFDEKLIRVGSFAARAYLRPQHGRR
jgi:hypothetical protein